MPTDEIPLVQLVVAVAAKWTGEVTVEPADGDDTVTVAKHGSADNKIQQKACLISLSSENQLLIREQPEN